MSDWRKYGLPALLLLAGAVLIFFYGRQSGWFVASSPAQPAPTVTPEPLLPTRTPLPVGETGDTVQPSATQAAPVNESKEIESPAAVSGSRYISTGERFGASGGLVDAAGAISAGLQVGSYFDWGLVDSPTADWPFEYWQTVRFSEEGIKPAWETIEDVIEANPGAIWLAGNEPDVIWQDNVTPERYAELYHELYTFVKERDATAKLAIGSVSQPTPLRMAYLDRILEAYSAQVGQPMPIDIWTVHGYILREEAGSWGVDIPPGMAVTTGRLYEISDHGDLDEFGQNLVDFRQWMADRGYQDRPLAVTEFGVIMPPDFGFPDEVKMNFMTESVRFMLTASGDTGFDADGGRLVQWWFWYSVYDDPERYPASNLYDPVNDELTVLGKAWSALADSVSD